MLDIKMLPTYDRIRPSSGGANRPSTIRAVAATCNYVLDRTTTESAERPVRLFSKNARSRFVKLKRVDSISPSRKRVLLLFHKYFLPPWCWSRSCFLWQQWQSAASVHHQIHLSYYSKESLKSRFPEHDDQSIFVDIEIDRNGGCDRNPSIHQE